MRFSERSSNLDVRLFLGTKSKILPRPRSWIGAPLSTSAFFLFHLFTSLPAYFDSPHLLLSPENPPRLRYVSGPRMQFTLSPKNPPRLRYVSGPCMQFSGNPGDREREEITDQEKRRTLEQKKAPKNYHIKKTKSPHKYFIPWFLQANRPGTIISISSLKNRWDNISKGPELCSGPRGISYLWTHIPGPPKIACGGGKKDRSFFSPSPVENRKRFSTGDEHFLPFACFFPLPLRGRGNKILPFFPIPKESEERPSPQIPKESEGTRNGREALFPPISILFSSRVFPRPIYAPVSPENGMPFSRGTGSGKNSPFKNGFTKSFRETRVYKSRGPRTFFSCLSFRFRWKEKSWISFIQTARHANLMNGFAGACLRRIREIRDRSEKSMLFSERSSIEKSKIALFLFLKILFPLPRRGRGNKILRNRNERSRICLIPRRGKDKSKIFPSFAFFPIFSPTPKGVGENPSFFFQKKDPRLPSKTQAIFDGRRRVPRKFIEFSGDIQEKRTLVCRRKSQGPPIGDRGPRGRILTANAEKKDRSFFSRNRTEGQKISKTGASNFGRNDFLPLALPPFCLLTE